VADPHQFNADPYPAFHFNADPDPAPHQSDANQRPPVYDPLGLHFEPPRLHCERPWPSMVSKLLDLNLNTDPDPAFHTIGSVSGFQK
jgi:hypothetical protein